MPIAPHLSSLSIFAVQGFDEYMNLVLDEAEEVHMKTKNRKTLGKERSVGCLLWILAKGFYCQ